MKLPSFIESVFGGRKRRFSVQFPATAEDAEKYYEVLAELFGQDIIPPLSFLRAVPKVNPYGLIIINDIDGKVLGGIELYGLKHDFLDDYLAGEKMDSDFRAHHLLDPERVVADGRLYCAITIDESGFEAVYGREYTKKIREIRDHLLVVTVGAIKEGYFSHGAARETLSIYAIEGTLGGKATLKQIGFKEISDGAKRKDQRPLYHLDLSRNEVDRILERTLNPPKRPERNSSAKSQDIKVRRAGKR